MNGGTLKRLLCGLLALLLLSVPAGISADSIVTINHGGQPQETEAPAAEGAETEAAIPEAEPTAEPAQAAPAKADVSLTALRGYDSPCFVFSHWCGLVKNWRKARHPLTLISAQ